MAWSASVRAARRLLPVRRNTGYTNLGIIGERLVQVKPLCWMGSSKRNLLALPGEVEDMFGYALYLAQVGKKHDCAKPLTGFGSAGVLEVVEDWEGNTYRAVYTVRGSVTPRADMELIRERLKAAEHLAKELEP